MKPIPDSAPASGRDGQRNAVRCQVAGHAACRIPLEQLAPLRQKPPLLRREPLPAAFLKHADEQSVAGLVALGEAIRGHGLEDIDFTHWGVIAAPRFLGRAALAVALNRFAAEGAWGISPHLIPHRSLHALSGTVSQALKIHGPNYGVGGGADGAAEALLVASALLADQQIPGVWVVLTGFDPELVPVDPSDADATPPVTECVAVAIALVPEGHGAGARVLTVGAMGVGERDTSNWPQFSLEDLAAVVAQGGGEASWQLRCGGWAAWEFTGAAAETCL